MSAAERLLHGYRSLAALTAAMVSAARAGGWEELIGLERRASALIAALRALGEVPLSTLQQAELKRLIAGVLADDAAIRAATKPWMNHLEKELQGAANARRLGSYAA